MKTPSEPSKTSIPTSISIGRTFSKFMRPPSSKSNDDPSAVRKGAAPPSIEREPDVLATRRPRAVGPAAEPPVQVVDFDEPIDEQSIEGGEDEGAVPQLAHASDLLAELVGRDIATRLRARFAEINARIHKLAADDATRAVWQTRAEPLNPDSWLTPEEILRGVNHADELFDALRRQLLS